MNYPKRIVYCCIISLLFLTSCFEIVEDTTIHSNGSGKSKVTFNFSKSKTKVASVMLLDSLYGYDIPSKTDINKSLAQAVDYINKTEGLSGAKYTSDFNNYIFTVSFQFSSVSKVKSAINKIINEHNNRSTTQLAIPVIYYDKYKKIFKRQFDYSGSLKKSFYSLKKEDKNLLQDANYVCIYRFDDDINKVSNSNAKISPNKKATFLKTDITSLVLGEKSIANTIYLK